MNIVYQHTPIGLLYRCRITGIWREAAVVGGVFYPIAIPCSLFDF